MTAVLGQEGGGVVVCTGDEAPDLRTDRVLPVAVPAETEPLELAAGQQRPVLDRHGRRVPVGCTARHDGDPAHLVPGGDAPATSAWPASW